MIPQYLKILLVSPLPPPSGGIASWTKQYIEWAENNSLSVEVVNTAVIGQRAEKINNKTRLFDEIKRTKLIIKDFKTKIIIFKPNIIHLNTPCGKLGIIRDFLCARIAKKNNIKLIIHYHCNIYDQVNNWLLSKYFLKKLANTADMNLVLNNSSMDYILKKTDGNTILMPNFISDDFVLGTPKVIRDEVRIVSFVGHVQRTKGIIEIIDAAKYTPQITYKVAGPVANDILKLQIPSNLILLGPISNQGVRDLLIESDVFLFPSHTEGFANALLEAMAMGMPIITTPVGANVDMIESMGGVIVDVGDSSSIIKAIEKIKNSNTRFRMSLWNVSKVKNHYTIGKVMRNLVEIYLACLK